MTAVASVTGVTAADRAAKGLLSLLVGLALSACGSSTPADSRSPGAATDAATDSNGGGSGGIDGGDGGSAAPTGDSGAGGADAAVANGSDDAGAGTGCTGAGTLCWGFEEGVTTPPGWSVGRTDYGAVVLPNDQTAHTGPALVVDETRPHWGKYSLHARNFAGGSPTTQGGPKATNVYTLPASFGPVLWGRVFVYTEPAAPVSHAGLFNARYPRPGSTATAITALDWYEVASYTQNYMTVWHPPEPPGYPEDVQVSGTPVVLDRFACLEWLFDGSPGDAGQGSAPRMWVDGTELSWPNSFTYPDASTPAAREPVESFLVLEAGVYLYQGLASTDWWLDDLAVGPQRIGCGG